MVTLLGKVICMLGSELDGIKLVLHNKTWDL